MINGCTFRRWDRGETIEYTVREEMRDSVNLARTDELWNRSVRTA